MKIVFYATIIALFASWCKSQPQLTDKQSLDKTTAAIRAAFGRGDVPAIVALHHPNVIKYFGGSDVVKGRGALTTGLTEMFKNVKLEFVENTVENTIFNDSIAIETSIFAFKATPKNGGKVTYSRGRSMVIYIRYKDSPYGWVSIREMAQAAPDPAKTK